MNTAELDAFFAKAEDVLTWEPYPHDYSDVMVATAPDEDAELDLAPAGESYYDQCEPMGFFCELPAEMAEFLARLFQSDPDRPDLHQRISRARSEMQATLEAELRALAARAFGIPAESITVATVEMIPAEVGAIPSD